MACRSPSSPRIIGRCAISARSASMAWATSICRASARRCTCRSAASRRAATGTRHVEEHSASSRIGDSVMDTSTKKIDDLEQERQDLVGEIVAEHGPAWTEQYRPGSFGCHELLDRSLLTAEFVEQTVLNHPA